MPIVPGDVVGCYLELNPSADKDHRRIDIHYSYNGQLLETPNFKLVETLTPDIALFPGKSFILSFSKPSSLYFMKAKCRMLTHKETNA